MKDPIVEEVRKRRMEHTERFRGDLDAICADLRSVQASSGHRVVRLGPRKPKPTKASSQRSNERGLSLMDRFSSSEGDLITTWPAVTEAVHMLSFSV
jgi:3-deoxy-D-arabino-heptulosonate 7-phosphate (DAHP) synthase